jgi:hypothetical protein
VKKARLGNRQWLTVVYTALGEHPIPFGKDRAILSWITTVASRSHSQGSRVSQSPESHLHRLSHCRQTRLHVGFSPDPITHMKQRRTAFPIHGYCLKEGIAQRIFRLLGSRAFFEIFYRFHLRLQRKILYEIYILSLHLNWDSIHDPQPHQCSPSSEDPPTRNPAGLLAVSPETPIDGVPLHMLLQTLVTGLAIGGVYALMATGYSLIFSIMGFSNRAYGTIIMYGAYFGLYSMTKFGLPFWAALLMSMIGAAALCVLNERIAYNPLRKRGAPSLFLSTLTI